MRLAARGPFIAGSEAELAGYFAAYRRGEFPYASSLRQEVG
jgi:quercetin 2,3-dioxygenase